MAALLVAGLAVGAAPALGQAFRSQDEFANWTTYYYRHPDRARLAASFRYFTASEAFARMPVRIVVSQFYAAAMDSDEVLLRQLADAVTGGVNPEAKLFALRIMWLCRCQAGRRLLTSAPLLWADSSLAPVTAALAAEEPPDLLHSAPGSALDLDMLWAIFFATGAPAPVERVVSVLESADTARGPQMLVGLAAQWSLTSNAVQHPRVLEILRALRSRATGRLARSLGAIIAAAERQPRRGGT